MTNIKQMRKIKRWALTMFSAFILLSLTRCGGKHVMDGPGMENPFVWKRFSISRSDSYAQYNFQLTVEHLEDRDCYVVTGALKDDEGMLYEDYQGIVLPDTACHEIDMLHPQNLAELVDRSEAASGAYGAGEPTPLDAPEVLLEVEYIDGTLQKKMDEDGFSIKIYEIVLPYFQEKYN